MFFSDSGIKYSILELGAGTGLFTRKVLPHLPKVCIGMVLHVYSELIL